VLLSLLLQKEHIETMSISHSSEIPTLAGGMINMDMIQNRNLSTNLRRTKIICTIGPACWDAESLEALIDAGMNVARLNFSHGDHPGHLAVLKRIRQAAYKKNRNVGMYLRISKHGLHREILLYTIIWHICHISIFC
jgi:Pyruvate kinase, barrel domain